MISWQTPCRSSNFRAADINSLSYRKKHHTSREDSDARDTEIEFLAAVDRWALGRGSNGFYADTVSCLLATWHWLTGSTKHYQTSADFDGHLWDPCIEALPSHFVHVHVEVLPLLSFQHAGHDSRPELNKSVRGNGPATHEPPGVLSSLWKGLPTGGPIDITESGEKKDMVLVSQCFESSACTYDYTQIEMTGSILSI